MNKRSTWATKTSKSSSNIGRVTSGSEEYWLFVKVTHNTSVFVLSYSGYEETISVDDEKNNRSSRIFVTFYLRYPRTIVIKHKQDSTLI